MECPAPKIIDLAAELAKLTLFRGRTPQSTMEERRGSGARLAPYRDGSLTTTKFAGKGHWEVHLSGDELIHALEGAATLEMVGEDGPESFPLRAGMLAVNPQGAWHRFHSVDGVTLMTATPTRGEIIELDVDDPRRHVQRTIDGKRPGISDLGAALAKLTLCRRTPQTTEAERQGSVARLAEYRDGALFAIKMAGKDHWEAHPTGDELIHVLDGTAALEIAGDGGPRSFALGAGMLAIVPQGVWHRFHAAAGATMLSATPFPVEHVALDVEDPRAAK